MMFLAQVQSHLMLADDYCAPELKSLRSTRATLRPLVAASTATPAPVAPPPTISKSNSSPSPPLFLSFSSISFLLGGVHAGGGRLVFNVEGGYEGPELRYQYPPTVDATTPAEAYASVRREMRRRKTMTVRGQRAR